MVALRPGYISCIVFPRCDSVDNPPAVYDRWRLGKPGRRGGALTLSIAHRISEYPIEIAVIGGCGHAALKYSTQRQLGRGPSTHHTETYIEGVSTGVFECQLHTVCCHSGAGRAGRYSGRCTVKAKCTGCVPRVSRGGGSEGHIARSRASHTVHCTKQWPIASTSLRVGHVGTLSALAAKALGSMA